YLEEAGDEDGARIRKVESEADLPDGAVVEAREGDYILENDQMRAFVETEERAMSACPWGGNIVDGQYKEDDGEWGPDLVGEICVSINIGLTLAPEEFEVVRDGSEGGPAILAVSGRLAVLDAVNIKAMAEDYAPGLLDLIGFDPDAVHDVAMTQYFIVPPDGNGVRVVNALRNDEDEALHMPSGHVLRGGAHGNYFNPLSSTGGWGHADISASNVEGDPLPFLTYAGPKASHGYVPTPDPSLTDSPADLPEAGVGVSMAGVGVSLLGRDDIVSTLLADEEELPELDGILHLEPGEVDSFGHWQLFGDGDLSTIVDRSYELIDAQTATVHGRVVDADGQPVENARVTAVEKEDDTAKNQARTDADGQYRMKVPPGFYELTARDGDRAGEFTRERRLAVGQELEADMQLDSYGEVSVSIATPDGEPTPGRISVYCVDSCTDHPTPYEEDVGRDSLPDDFARLVWADSNGEADFKLPEGNYRVAVSRGMTWSIWPNDASDDGGYELDIEGDDSHDIEAEIEPVVDTTGAISADFHVHAETSPDSVVRLPNRVRGFMGEGVDILVSTDHDYVTDYGPEIERQGAENHIASMVGTEITTPSIGHFNAYPLEHDPEHRRGGALDWARGDDYDMTPTEIFDWVDNQDGDPDSPTVSQMNHPHSTIEPLEADVLRGTTLTEREGLRMDPDGGDPDSDDTGLWSDDFTAIELMNTHSMSKYRAIKRWWLTMISRGFSPTATAVTDTHRLYHELGASPRSFVFVDEDHDTIDTFDEDVVAESVNDNRVVGTNGPFFEVELENDDGDTAGLGETLDAQDQSEVTAHLDIQTPEWIEVDTVEVYSNLDAEDIVTEPGEAVDDPLEPTDSKQIEWSEDDLEVVAENDQPHRRRATSVEMTVDVEEDAYVVFVVRSEASNDMWPVLPRSSAKPFAFSNPIFVDADGGGYDNPPLEDLAETEIEEIVDERGDDDLQDEREDLSKRERLEEFLRHIQHKH
ncbi:MAG: CehA/McbA family metallohydrolase, partial [Persicimonas sp.]